VTKLTKFIRRYTSISATIDILQRKELSLLDPQTWDDRNDRYFMNLYRESKKLGGLYALCASTSSETYHHWRVFTHSADGACIEIKRAPLEAELADVQGVRFQEVRYLRLEDVAKLNTKDRDQLPFVKRMGFQPEDEYRIIAETSDPQQAAIALEFPTSLIAKIYLNPWLPASVAETLTAVLRKIPGCSNLEISRSHLIDSARWKRAGDKVVGKPQPPRIKLIKSKPKP
jgi:hypothetical protein